MRKIHIVPGGYKPKDREEEKYPGCDSHVAGVFPKGPRKVFGEKFPYQVKAVAIGAVYFSVGADNEAVQVIDEFRVAGFGSRDRQVSRRTPVKLSEFADLRFREAAERIALEHRKQILEPLPIIFPVADKRVHFAFDCKYLPPDWQY
jgi:hypothetical protein